MPQIIKINEKNKKEIINLAVKTLQSGGLVVFPTETMYGIGALATNQRAIDKLLAYKTRREGKPLSIAVYSKGMAQKYVEINDTGKNLYDNFLPGPLTVVSKGKHAVAKGIESETGTLGVRIPDYPLVLEIIRRLGLPITATSANASYQKRPYSIQDIFDNVSEKQKNLIDLVIDAGELPKREPSTVVDTTLNEKVILRQGDIALTPILERMTKSGEETQDLGKEIVRKYKHYLGYKSVILAMQGELGAGKTEMTKGVASELGVRESIQSPTFVIEKEYTINTASGSFAESKHPMLYHIDTWRIENANELEKMGLLEQIDAGNIFAIEWADKITEFLKRVSENTIIIWIRIEHGTTENERTITISDFNKND